jgi:nicotinamide riboside kinase
MQHPIKLALVGGSATGKTTLWAYLKEKYRHNPQVLFVHESAREHFSKPGVEVNFSLTNQKQILELGLQNEKDAVSHNPKIILTDTTPIETVFYTKAHGDEEGAEMLLKKIRPWISTYTKFLLLNPEDIQFQNDTIRRETRETRDKIHSLMVDFYHKEHLPFTLISGTIPEREKKISDSINAYLAV